MPATTSFPKRDVVLYPKDRIAFIWRFRSERYPADIWKSAAVDIDSESPYRSWSSEMRVNFVLEGSWHNIAFHVNELEEYEYQLVSRKKNP